MVGLGAVGYFVAVRTGDAAQEAAGEGLAQIEALIDAHESWAERTQIAGAIAGRFGNRSRGIKFGTELEQNDNH